MVRMIKAELYKLKRFHILIIGFIGMTLPAILSIVTQKVIRSEARIQNFDFSDLINSTIWNQSTIFMPVIFTLIGGYLINREYTDDTLKNIIPVPISFRYLLFAKLITMGILSALFGLYSYGITLIVGLSESLLGLNFKVISVGLFQMMAISILVYIAVLPIIAFTARKPDAFMGGVIIAFLYGYSSMFVKEHTMRSLYPILSGLTIIGFDTESFMNTTEPGSIPLAILSLIMMMLLTMAIVRSANVYKIGSIRKKKEIPSIFLRSGQKGR